MTPAELEALLEKAHAQNFDKYRDQRIEFYVGPTLCKLAPALLDLWRAAENVDRARIEGTWMDFVKAEGEVESALARLREVKA